ncbi:glycosyltransferase family 4 protein [Crocosphaera sp. UHCC 0190]|uniref:glycosyltransferase family 4 protein n=1 Tax=Crocosphaera sp. UHCC 0190 TaxID=3110246 RepID=UPI002B1FA28E|nr:glycosyltransferase family 4 protein [Crocosphaera sp. UHCC 0190]MEA5510778.1 glycosyltransferase family 4 protein [Crocosphaera sp. UHCC 0190]
MNWDNDSIVIYANFPFHVEDWSPLSVNKGVGGSEEAVIYLSQELVKLGYQVTIFNRCGEMEGKYNGVVYQSADKFNPQDNFNVLIFHRAWIQPMQMKVKARKTAVWMHDNPQLFSPVEDSQKSEFLASFDKLFMLSNFQTSLLPEWIPEDKIFLTTNGINLEDFSLTGITRNPKRLISISDYTRGIEHLLNQWDRVLQEVPDVELHIFYGWQGIDALINSPYIERFPQLPDKKKRILQLFEHKNVYEHGRIGHKELVKELFQSGIWVYPCHTAAETFCISAWKAQAAGCVPVVTTCAALDETVKSGIRIKGPAGDEETNNAFIEAVIDLLKNPEKQESLRREALALKDSFGWDKVAQQWHEKFIST